MPCTLLHLIVTERQDSTLAPAAFGRDRWRRCVHAAALMRVPICALTGRVLSVSAIAKAIETDRFLKDQHIDSYFSAKFFKTMAALSYRQVGWFVTSRVVDGTWIVGGRILFQGDSSVPPRQLLSEQTRSGKGPGKDPALLLFPALVVLIVLGPSLAGGLRAWLAFLSRRLKRLGRFNACSGSQCWTRSCHSRCTRFSWATRWCGGGPYVRRRSWSW